MAEVTLIGGFASTRRQYETYSQLVESRTGRSAKGYGFHEAAEHLEQLAEEMDRRDVITHSGGLLIAHDALRLGVRPRSITAIAPSIPSQVRTLVPRGLLINLRNPVQQEQFRQKVQTESAKHEVMAHLGANIQAVRRLGHFASLDFMADTSARGIETTVALMTHDGLFDNNKIPDDKIMSIIKAGGQVLRVAGVHTSFTSSPLEVLERIDAAPSWLDAEPLADELHYDLPMSYCLSGLRTTIVSRFGSRQDAIAA